jgi:hypothetical protein
MEKRTKIRICSFAVIGVVILLSGCCKDDDSDNPASQVPVFTVTAKTVMLQGGGDGLQFSAICTNEDVKMTKVTNTPPNSAQTATYELSGKSYAKNSPIPLQNDNEAYLKVLGTWTFTFVGNTASDNKSFSVNATLLITAK